MTPRPEPLFFGKSNRALFGWLHRPAGQPRDVGLVICNPYGYEAICAHRALRRLAIMAADAGIATLRFDYDGTGDSAGSDLDPARIDAWIRSIYEAVDTLKDTCALTRVALAGVRLGGSLATIAASRRDDIDSLILIAPVISGRAYLRELRALQIAAGQESHSSSAHVAQEAIGFNFTAETQQALREIDLTKLPLRPAARTLLFAKNDAFGIEPFAAHLRSLDSTVSQQDPTGYAEMMLDAHETQVPHTLWAACLAWLTNESSRAPAGLQSRSERAIQSQTLISDSSRTVREQAVFVEDDASAFAIITTAEELGARPRAVILLNAGAVHHVGPNRMYVELARRWAHQNLIIMRLDLSGLGDSAPRAAAAENVVYSSHANEDLARAVRYLRERFGATEIESIGLCSGGYHGLKAVSAGVGLHRVTLINPLTFFWKEGMSMSYPQYRVVADAQRYRKNAFQLASWIKMLKGQVDLRSVMRVGIASVFKLTSGMTRRLARLFRMPLSNDLGFELDRLAKRGVALVFVFAMGEPGLELLETQGGSIVRRLEARNRLHIDIIENADHTFTPHASREQLMELLTDRITQPPGAALPTD